jgi:hypothetical protein
MAARTPAAVRAAIEYLSADRRVTSITGGFAVRCPCPRHVAGLDTGRPVIVLHHAPDCAARHPERQTEARPDLPLPPGVVPCPRCGNRAYSLVADGRRCDGPSGCGYVWAPGRPGVT